MIDSNQVDGVFVPLKKICTLCFKYRAGHKYSKWNFENFFNLRKNQSEEK